jgi:hypothetical protein
LDPIRLKFPVVLGIVAALSGCAAPLPNYTEADPGKTKTARLRVVAFPGVNTYAVVYPDNSRECISSDGALHLKVHTNTSGFAGESKKKIGMPFGESGFGKWGSEFLIPADKPITIGATYSGGDGYSSVGCSKTLRFEPKPGRDYQVNYFAGLKNMFQGACSYDLAEIKEGRVDAKGNIVLTPVPHTLVWVEGTVDWKVHCTAR